MENRRSRSDDESVENLARENLSLMARQREENPDVSDPSPDRPYQCKDCDKKYETFQALGGHRASHKKVKPNDGDDGSENQSSLTSFKLYECKICGDEFATGQALGGHMRRHQGMKLEQMPMNSINQADETAAEGSNNEVEAEQLRHDMGDELTQPEVNGVRTAMLLHLLEKADNFPEQAAGEEEVAKLTKDSAPTSPREGFKCSDLNLPPDEDDADNKAPIYYYFLEGSN